MNFKSIFVGAALLLVGFVMGSTLNEIRSARAVSPECGELRELIKDHNKINEKRNDILEEMESQLDELNK